LERRERGGRRGGGEGREKCRGSSLGIVFDGPVGLPIYILKKKKKRGGGKKGGRMEREKKGSDQIALFHIRFVPCITVVLPAFTWEKKGKRKGERKEKVVRRLRRRGGRICLSMSKERKKKRSRRKIEVREGAEIDSAKVKRDSST